MGSEGEEPHPVPIGQRLRRRALRPVPGQRILSLTQVAQRQLPAVLQFAGNIAVVGVDLVELSLGQQRLIAQALDLLDLGAVEGFVRLMAAPDDVIGPINLGNPGEFTIRQLAELVIDMTGSKSEMVFKPLPQDDPTQRRPDISRAKEKLGWEPTVPLKEGLARTIAYFERKLPEWQG